VRELQNAIQFAFVKCDGQVIEAEDLPLELRQAGKVCARRGPARKLMPEAVAKALGRTGGNKAKAAKLMGVGRATLYRFLNDHPELA
jgi:transcriptional regulator of acetoin/glycerol metabolism